MNIRISLFVLLSAALLFACSSNNSGKGEKAEKAGLNVVDSLLGPAYVIERSNVSIRPPLGFNPIPDSLLQTMRQQFARQSEVSPGDSILLDQFFFDTTFSSALVVATVGGLTLGADTASYLARFSQELQNKYGADHVTRGDFRIAGVHVKSFVARDSATVRQTLLCLAPNAPAAELQFVIPQVYYDLLHSSVKSSIATIAVSTQEK